MLCLPVPKLSESEHSWQDIQRGVVEDEVFDAACTRVILDAFWSRSSNTVAGHVREINYIIKYATWLGISNPFPRWGPFPRYYHMGMQQQAIMVIMRSMEKGKGKAGRVKYGTARNIRSAYTVLWDISPEAGGDITLSTSDNKGRYTATCNPSEVKYYQHFALGCCARMGDVVKQDRAYTIQVLLKLLEMYEEEYALLGANMQLESICSCMFLLLGGSLVKWD